MPTRTGTASQVNGSGGNGSTSVTVPSDATMAVAFWSHLDAGSTTLATLTLGGNSFSVESEIATHVITNANGVGVGVLTALPGTGSQTLTWTWSSGGARDEGGEIVVVWVKDHNLATPVRDSGTTSNTGGTVAVTINTETTDLVIAFCESFTPTNPGIDGTVFINNASLNSNIYDVSEVTAGTPSTAINMTGENFSSMAAISLPVVLNTGFLYAGVAAQSSTPNLGWASITFSLGAPNATVATVNPDAPLEQSENLYLYGFDFDFNASAIVGIEVEIYGGLSGSGDTYTFAFLHENETLVGTQQDASGLGIGSPVVLGGASDMWGTSLTEGDIEDPNFGVAIYCGVAEFGSIEAEIDAVAMKVYYTEAAAPVENESPYRHNVTPMVWR